MLLTNLKTLRKAQKGLTQTQLAQQVHVSPATISRLESGDRLPSWGLTCRLALALDVSIQDLTDEPERTNDAA